MNTGWLLLGVQFSHSTSTIVKLTSSINEIHLTIGS